MGPKVKQTWRKKAVVEKNEDPEFVSILMKQFFDLQMADIERKTARRRNLQVELEQARLEIERKLAEFEKEQGVIISGLKVQVEELEKIRVAKRTQMYWLMDELKTRVMRYKERIKQMEKEYQEMVETLSAEIEVLEERLGVLEDFKQNKEEYLRGLEEEEEAMHEREREHQRSLFEIARKLEVAKVRLKKELESRLLQLSVDFQETTENKLGTTTHRLIQENIAIENELKIMRDDLDNYQEEYDKATRNMKISKDQQKAREDQKNDYLAKTVVQFQVIQQLLEDKQKLYEQALQFQSVESENSDLQKRLAILEHKFVSKEEKSAAMEKELTHNIEEATVMGEASYALKKCFRKMQVILRSSFRIAEQADAVSLIPLGGTTEEMRMTHDSRLQLFQARRNGAFTKKGRLLKYLLDVIAKAQLADYEKSLLKSSNEAINLSGVKFYEVYGGRRPTYEELVAIPVKEPSTASAREASLELSESDTSLPRPESTRTLVREEADEEMEDEDEVEEEGVEEEIVEGSQLLKSPAPVAVVMPEETTTAGKEKEAEAVPETPPPPP